MANFLISFPAAAMTLTGDDLRRSDTESRKVVARAKAEGVWVFGAGIDERVTPELIGADGTITPGGYPGAPPITGAAHYGRFCRVQLAHTGRRRGLGRPAGASLRLPPRAA